MLGRQLCKTTCVKEVTPLFTQAKRNYPGRNKIKIELSEQFTSNPRPTKYFEDPQGAEPFQEENGGINVYLRRTNTLYKQIAAVAPPKFETSVPYTQQDTLYTYTKRIHKIQMKTLAHWFRKMEVVRMARLNEVAVKEANVLFIRKAEYAAWKARKKANNLYNWTLQQQKRAAELRSMYKHGKIARENAEVKLAGKHQTLIESFIEEKRKHWITDPENVSESIFEAVHPGPTGFWPVERTKGFKDSFVTDDEDKENYFKTERPKFTRIEPQYDEFGSFYVNTKNTAPQTGYNF